MHSQQLMQCLIKLEVPEYTQNAKMELVAISRRLMPEGKPNYLGVIRYPMIKELIDAYGRKTIHKVLYLMVKDFCSSLNVVRNMNQEQMLECAAILLDDCGNFRLEDYTMMFSMGKRGHLIKIYDRLDISVITEMLDEYWRKRNEMAERQYIEQNKYYNKLGDNTRTLECLPVTEAKMITAAERLTGTISELKTRLNS